MEDSTLIRKVHMDCPLCDKTHEVEERKRFTTITLKGDKVTYEERFYFCANADDEENEFETGSMTNENLLNARNAYRVNHGLSQGHGKLFKNRCGRQGKISFIPSI